jgi:hypothetical protein
MLQLGLCFCIFFEMAILNLSQFKFVFEASVLAVKPLLLRNIYLKELLSLALK